jgi:hypothetical protein
MPQIRRTGYGNNGTEAGLARTGIPRGIIADARRSFLSGSAQ